MSPSADAKFQAICRFISETVTDTAKVAIEH